MKVVVLGATGGCGRWFVRLAALRGHQVTATVRPDSPLYELADVFPRKTDVLSPCDLNE
jgi:uncharacterized protein YbjT (DUF2867 family)